MGMSLGGLAVHALNCALLPLYSLVSRRMGFAVFYRWNGRWWLHTRGRSVPVVRPCLEALEYYRHHMPPPGALVFDVGGELGLETEQFAGLVGAGGRVLVFECLPEHVRALSALAARLPQVQVVDGACWDCATTLQLHVGHTPGSNTAVPDARGQRGQPLGSDRVIEVRAQTLDHYWRTEADAAEVDLLKMDIEGAELEALDGATQMLRHTRHAVIAAYHLRDGEPTAERVARRLSAAGFVTRIDENLHVYAWR